MAFIDVKKALFAEVQNHVAQCWKTAEDKTIVQAFFECVNAKPVSSVEDVELHLKKGGPPINVEKINTIGEMMSSANLLSKVGVKKWTFHSNVERLYFDEHPQVTVMS